MGKKIKVKPKRSNGAGMPLKYGEETKILSKRVPESHHKRLGKMVDGELELLKNKLRG